MNTEQKAREWLAENVIDIVDVIKPIYDAHEIITALLNENRALLEAANGVMAIVKESHGVDGWHRNGDAAKWEMFSEITELEQAIAMCEENQDG